MGQPVSCSRTTVRQESSPATAALSVLPRRCVVIGVEYVDFAYPVRRFGRTFPEWAKQCVVDYGCLAHYRNVQCKVTKAALGRSRHCPDLVHHAQPIFLGPEFGNFTVGDPVNGHAGDRDRSPCRCDAAPLPAVGARMVQRVTTKSPSAIIASMVT
jgi:hypothetical protein